MARRTYSEDEKQAALNLYRDIGPTAASKKLDIPKQRIQEWAKAAGVRTVRNERIAHAVEAVQHDAKLRRANISQRLYGQAEKMLDDLEADEYRMLVRAFGGAEEEKTLNFVPAVERRTLVAAINQAMKTTSELEARDLGNGVDRAESMLDKLAAELREVAKHAGDVDEAAPLDS